MNFQDFYKPGEEMSFQKRIDEENLANLNEHIVKNDLRFMFHFSDLINELINKPTTFTLIKLKDYIQKPEAQKCTNMIDEKVINVLLILADPNNNDLNIRQNSFFVIGEIIRNFQNKMPIFLNLQLIPLIKRSLLVPNRFFVGSIYFVINCLIIESFDFRSSFYQNFKFNFLFQSAYKFLNDDHNDLIVECFKSIVEYVGINSEKKARKLVQIFQVALAKKLKPEKDISLMDMCSCNFALIGIIQLLKTQDIPAYVRKLVIEDSSIPMCLQFFFKLNEFTSETINATILASQLYSLNVSNIPDILPQILKLFQLYSFDPNYHNIIYSLNNIIEFCNDHVFNHLIRDLKLLDVIINLIPRSNFQTKKEIYSCFSYIILRLPKSDFSIFISEEKISFLFDLIEMNDLDFINKVIADIYNIFITAEEIGQNRNANAVFISISAIPLIEDIFQKNIDQQSFAFLNYIYQKLVGKEQEFE